MKLPFMQELFSISKKRNRSPFFLSSSFITLTNFEEYEKKTPFWQQDVRLMKLSLHGYFYRLGYFEWVNKFIFFASLLILNLISFSDPSFKLLVDWYSIKLEGEMNFEWMNKIIEMLALFLIFQLISLSDASLKLLAGLIFNQNAWRNEMFH